MTKEGWLATFYAFAPSFIASSAIALFPRIDALQRQRGHRPSFSGPPHESGAHSCRPHRACRRPALMPPGSLNPAVPSQPSGSPPRKVVQLRFAGSITLILLLYALSATNSLPSAQATPSACCSCRTVLAGDAVLMSPKTNVGRRRRSSSRRPRRPAARTAPRSPRCRPRTASCRRWPGSARLGGEAGAAPGCRRAAASMPMPA